MEWITDPSHIISLLTLTVLEIVLGIDNIIFISILGAKLPAAQQGKARTAGLLLALITRVLLLCSIFLVTKLIHPLFSVCGRGFSGKDLVMIAGGLFLLWKSVREIHGTVEGEEREEASKTPVTFGAIVFQIVVIDIIFSLDSVITAVGVAREIGVMITAVILAMGVMLLASAAISGFVNRHPSIKMLALSFLILVGVVLIADGFGEHIQKGYIYFAMAFSFSVEMLNIKLRARRRKMTKPASLPGEVLEEGNGKGRE
jgi:predicted tellurium resistance membrane protein TerC